MEDLEDSDHLSTLPETSPHPHLPRPHSHFHPTTPVTHFPEFHPLEYTDFFDERREVDVNKDVFNVYLKGNKGPIFLLLHGAGYTGLTWACFTEELTKKSDCRILAPDLRGHGLTKTSNDNDLSLETQIQDISSIFNVIYGDLPKNPIVTIIGHSMGGALAVHLCIANLIPNVQVLAVIDVVEGSAMAALASMTTVIRNRPKSFVNMESAIRWCHTSGMTKNLKAARVSMPSQIVLTNNHGREEYKWRTRLISSEPYWKGWFQGMTKSFLSVRAVKVLILANIDRLDTDLTVGQMQGQFQHVVFPKVGHAVHEDEPEKVAEVFSTLLRRYKVIFDKF